MDVSMRGNVLLIDCSTCGKLLSDFEIDFPQIDQFDDWGLEICDGCYNQLEPEPSFIQRWTQLEAQVEEIADKFSVLVDRALIATEKIREILKQSTIE